MVSKTSDVTLIAYIPSPHAGYIKLFKKYGGGTLFVLGSDIIADFQPLVRNLPANKPEDVVTMIRALNIFSDVQILTKEMLSQAALLTNVVMPDEDVCRSLVEQHFDKSQVTLDGSWRLRWHWDAAQKGKSPEDKGLVISKSEFDRQMVTRAYELADKSPDWWRQIGALLVRDGKVLLAGFNNHRPNEQSLYLEGDPRSNFEPGQCIDASAARHAEAGIIAAVAGRSDMTTKGCDMYVTTFPCPPCAYSLADSGIRRLFFAEGYSLVAGADDLRAKNVEIIRVQMDPTPS